MLIKNIPRLFSIGHVLAQRRRTKRNFDER